MRLLRRLAYAGLALAFSRVVLGAVARATGVAASAVRAGALQPAPASAGGDAIRSSAGTALAAAERGLVLGAGAALLALLGATLLRRREPGVGGRGGVLRASALAVGVGAATVALTGVGGAPGTIAIALQLALVGAISIAALRAGGLGATDPEDANVGADAGAAGVARGRSALATAGAALLAALSVLLGPAIGGGALAVVVALLLVLVVATAVGVLAPRDGWRETEAGRAGRIALGTLLLQLVVGGALAALALPGAARTMHEALGALVWLALVVTATLVHRASALAPAMAPAVVAPALATTTPPEAELPGPVPVLASDFAAAADLPSSITTVEPVVAETTAPAAMAVTAPLETPAPTIVETTAVEEAAEERPFHFPAFPLAAPTTPPPVAASAAPAAPAAESPAPDERAVGDTVGDIAESHQAIEALAPDASPEIETVAATTLAEVSSTEVGSADVAGADVVAHVIELESPVENAPLQAESLSVYDSDVATAEELEDAGHEESVAVAEIAATEPTTFDETEPATFDEKEVPLDVALDADSSVAVAEPIGAIADELSDAASEEYAPVASSEIVADAAPGDSTALADVAAEPVAADTAAVADVVEDAVADGVSDAPPEAADVEPLRATDARSVAEVEQVEREHAELDATDADELFPGAAELMDVPDYEPASRYSALDDFEFDDMDVDDLVIDGPLPASVFERDDAVGIEPGVEAEFESGVEPEIEAGVEPGIERPAAHEAIFDEATLDDVHAAAPAIEPEPARAEPAGTMHAEAMPAETTAAEVVAVITAAVTESATEGARAEGAPAEDAPVETTLTPLPRRPRRPPTLAVLLARGADF